MRLEFSRQIFEKLSNIKFHENPSSVSRVAPCGQTDKQAGRQRDRHDEANSLFIFDRASWYRIEILQPT
jgi:hypothetical protein